MFCMQINHYPRHTTSSPKRSFEFIVSTCFDYDETHVKRSLFDTYTHRFIKICTRLRTFYPWGFFWEQKKTKTNSVKTSSLAQRLAEKQIARAKFHNSFIQVGTTQDFESVLRLIAWIKFLINSMALQNFEIKILMRKIASANFSNHCTCLLTLENPIFGVGTWCIVNSYRLNTETKEE